jgi:antitoxin component YwqK of YwqJK toxin-antitoxin module
MSAAKKAKKKVKQKARKKSVGKTRPHVQKHRDGSLWAKGQTLGGLATGRWQWFRKDGSRLRSGHFEQGQQVGEWITYDRKGEVYKVTQIKAKRGGSWGP